MSDAWKRLKLGERCRYSEHYFAERPGVSERFRQRRGRFLSLVHYDRNGARIADYDPDGASMALVKWDDDPDYERPVHVHNIEPDTPAAERSGLAAATTRQHDKVLDDHGTPSADDLASQVLASLEDARARSDALNDQDLEQELARISADFTAWCRNNGYLKD